MTKPAPADSPQLRTLLAEAESELGFSSNLQSVINVGMSGVTNFASTTRTDDRLVYRGVVGVKHEPHDSKASKHRELWRAFLTLSPWHRAILGLAYGPEATVPGLALPDDPQARKRLGQHLGAWRCVLIATWTAQQAFAWSLVIDARTHGKRWQLGDERNRDLPLWLRCHAPDWVLREARKEALGLVNEAWAAWDAVRPRGKRKPEEGFVYQPERPGEHGATTTTKERAA